MADFFSKLKKSIDKGTAIVSAKSNTLIETNKLKSEIGTANRIKKETLMAIGTKVYEDGKAGIFTIESVEELITKVTEQDAKVADLEAKIELIQAEEKDKMDAINSEDVVVQAEEVVEEPAAEAPAEPVAEEEKPEQ